MSFTLILLFARRQFCLELHSSSKEEHKPIVSSEAVPELTTKHFPTHTREALHVPPHDCQAQVFTTLQQRHRIARTSRATTSGCIPQEHSRHACPTHTARCITTHKGAPSSTRYWITSNQAQTPAAAAGTCSVPALPAPRAARTTHPHRMLSTYARTRCFGRCTRCMHAWAFLLRIDDLQPSIGWRQREQQVAATVHRQNLLAEDSALLDELRCRR